mmetsp:Transcript_15333/g.43881  ORF Transcript_15333/g.43881 Transcript_15333/m.43881 type:complete len:436 (+) Transcript_15333:82-1389(+)
MAPECWAVAILVPLAAVGLLSLQEPEDRKAKPQFDTDSWVWKFHVYAALNPRPLTLDKSTIVDWANRFHQFEPFNALPCTPTLSCETRASLLIDRFDWKIAPDSAYNISSEKELPCGSVDALPWKYELDAEDPRSVWAAPHALPRLLELAAERLDPRRAGRVVVFSGTEMPLSAAFGHTEAERNATVSKLRKYFSRILYQTKDIQLEHVHLAPMGMSWGYLMFLITRWHAFPFPYLALADLATNLFMRTTTSSKNLTVLAAWGKVAGWLERPRTHQLCHHFRKVGKLFPPSNSSLRAVQAAGMSRKLLRGWLNSSAAQAVGAEFRQLNVSDYWYELPKYKFLLSPMGSNIQTAKTVEALLVLTVPIVQHMGFTLHAELVELGFPIVVVERWYEITPANISKWWEALSPRLESFRRNCLTIDGFWSIYTGRVRSCH